MARTRQTARESNGSRSSSTLRDQHPTLVDKLRMSQVSGGPFKDEATVKEEVTADDEETADDEATARDNEPTVYDKATANDESTDRDNEPTAYDEATANDHDVQRVSTEQYLSKVKEEEPDDIEGQSDDQEEQRGDPTKTSDVDEFKKTSASPEPMNMVHGEPSNEHQSRASTPLSELSEYRDSARESSASPLHLATNNRHDPISRSQTSGVVNTIEGNQSSSKSFTTLLKRKRTELAADGVIITGSVRKARKPANVPPTNKELKRENEMLKLEIDELRLAHKQSTIDDITVFKFVSSASMMETAVEKRESEMRRGLNHMSEHLKKLQDRMAELIKFSNTTTDTVSRVIQTAGGETEEGLSKADTTRLQKIYENAKPKGDIAVAVHEKLSFTPHLIGRPKTFRYT